MIDNFPTFAQIVAKMFQRMAKGTAVFTAGVTGDDLYATYLGAFPEGTNPIFKKVTEHDCGCCKSFIRRVGNVVLVNEDGQIQTIWDSAAKSAPAPYNTVAAALRDRVLASPIDNLFRVSLNEASFGAEKTRSQDKETGKVYTWDHFFTGPIPNHLRVASPGEVCGAFRTTVEVFERGLTELSPEAVSTVMDLITSNALYRGEEHKGAVQSFQRAQQAYLSMGADKRRTFAWGTKVRFNATMAERMGRFGTKTGIVTGPPIGSSKEPPGGLWVLWEGLCEPAPCFEKDLKVIE